MVQFIVPGQPQGKGRHRVGNVRGHARMFTPAKTVAYESLIALAAQHARGQGSLIEGPVSCSIELNCTIPKSWSKQKRKQAIAGEIVPTTKPDCDNTAKAVMDALNGVIWHDDTQVTTLIVSKHYSEVPCLRVVIAWQPN
jgi:Holliday junction resolvase RusA-like endonuclease